MSDLTRSQIEALLALDGRELVHVDYNKEWCVYAVWYRDKTKAYAMYDYPSQAKRKRGDAFDSECLNQGMPAKYRTLGHSQWGELKEEDLRQLYDLIQEVGL